LKSQLSRRLTPMQAAGIVLLLGVIAVLGFFAYRFAQSKLLEARVRAALPAISAEVRQQRDAIGRALEAYKTQFGTYPADHLVSLQPLVVDPVTNTLFYELCGVVLNAANRRIQVAGLEPAELDYVTNFLHCPLFRNFSDRTDGVKRFLPKENTASRQFHDDPDVFALGFNITSETVPSEVIWEVDLSTWRYISSSPTNNPGKYDLWIELKTKDHAVTIGNWAAVQ
jgi:hypothetical protein